MYEDKLTHDERLRLECLAQANGAVAPRLGQTMGDVAFEIVRTARVFEAFVTGSDTAD